MEKSLTTGVEVLGLMVACQGSEHKAPALKKLTSLLNGLFTPNDDEPAAPHSHYLLLALYKSGQSDAQWFTQGALCSSTEQVRNGQAFERLALVTIQYPLNDLKVSFSPRDKAVKNFRELNDLFRDHIKRDLA